jgi:endonuclease/exonuclease/phosphatase family metal-dependent hydrolase
MPIESTVRILTLNLWGRRGNWPARRRVLSDRLAALRPDVIAFQESIVTDSYDQPADLLGSSYRCLHQTRREMDGQGITIASCHPLRPIAEVGPRVDAFAAGTLVSEIELPPPFGTLIFANHCPNWQSDLERAREAQTVAAARAVEAAVAERGRPAILAGDLTADPESASVRFLRGLQSLDGISVCYQDVWVRAHPDDAGHTFAPDNPLRSARWQTDPARRIDYIFLRCGACAPPFAVRDCALAFAGPQDGVWTSDHFGVVADLVVAGS